MESGTKRREQANKLNELTGKKLALMIRKFGTAVFIEKKVLLRL
jgi:hypothetical protein